jgi:hypothetical protein
MGKRFFSSLQTGSATQQAPYEIGVRRCFLKVKKQRGEADHSPPSAVSTLRTVGYTFTPTRINGVVFNYLSRRIT